MFTGIFDKYFQYQLVILLYRSVPFETDVLEKESYQDNVVVNDTEQEVPYTRIIEHKYFEFGKQPFPTNILLNSNRGMSILFDQ